MLRSKAILAIFVLIVFIAIQMACSRRQNGVAARSVYRHTAQQMIDLSTPICQAMLPERGDLYISAEPITSMLSHQRTGILWNVVYTDGSGTPLLYVMRDDETGELLLSTLQIVYDTDHKSEKPPLTAASAGARARDWMRALGFHETWQVVGTPQRDRSRWHIILSNAGRRAYLNITSRKGYLVSIDFRPGSAKTM